MNERLRDWAPDAFVAFAILLLGLAEIWVPVVPVDEPNIRKIFIVLGFAAVCGLSRKAPLTALTLIWVVCALQLLIGVAVLTVQFSVAIVAFGCARWGHTATVVLSGLSIPAGAGIGLLVVMRGSLGAFSDIAVLREIIDGAYRFSDTLLVGATVLGLLILAVPWLAGLALRAMARAERSEETTEQAKAEVVRAQVAADQARIIARLQEDQVRLARDVHDVVGHSLAVILAQAESGQYLADDDPAALKRTLATIAGSARSSLQDVRQVLTAASEPTPARTGSFEEVVAGVRAGGHEVIANEVGAPQPLPPELDVAAHRVVQEMLTNAIKHGRRDRPVRVERHWPEGSWDRDLRIEVRNIEAYDSGETQPLHADGPPGQGLDGMRRRLEAVGGRLDVRRRDEDGEATFTVTAWLPVSGR